MVTASELFDFIASRSEHSVERHVVVLKAFSDLRRSVRRGIGELKITGGQEVLEDAGRLLSAISLWLTAPVRFDDSVVLALQKIGEPTEIEARWGSDIRRYFEDACRAARELAAGANPLRTVVLDIIREMRAEGRSFRILCHKRSRQFFDQQPEDPGWASLPEEAFIHSLTNYRATEPFDVLLKVGPLRSSGWGCAPDAILTAPRYGTLIQVVWSGCRDQQDFGYDPLGPSVPADSGAVAASAENRRTENLSAKWSVKEVCHGDVCTGDQIGSGDEDDLEVFAQLRRSENLQRAKLVQIDDSHGIFFSHQSKVFSFDVDDKSIDIDQPVKTLDPGMYLIWPVLDDVRLGKHRANGGRLSPLWKKKLDDEARRDADGLVKRLRDAGIRLSGLKFRIDDWRKAPSSVIRAPQQRDHFRILIDVLGVDFGASEPVRGSRHAWWEYAWDEIRRSRGEAIKSGFEDQKAAEEDFRSMLDGLVHEIEANLGKQIFELPIPPENHLKGKVSFYKVLAVEDGFEVPQAQLSKLHELDEVEEWRT